MEDRNDKNYSGFVMLGLENPDWESCITRFGEMNKVDYKWEPFPHVTIGLFIKNTELKNVVRAVFSQIQFGAEINLKTVRTGHFSNPSQIILKFDDFVNPKYLYMLNSICQSFDNKNPWKSYSPHITLAYIDNTPANELIAHEIWNPSFKIKSLSVSYKNAQDNTVCMHIKPDFSYSMELTDSNGNSVTGRTELDNCFLNFK